jgi:formylglycine-generating enzyme required for sulfatase activity
VLLTLLLLTGCGGGKSTTDTLVSVTIDTLPVQGASVLMMGVDQGNTPVTVHEVLPGDYEVVLRLDKYRRAIEPITVTEEKEQHFSIELEPILGFLSITTQPGDAEVILNDESLGKAPVVKHALQVGEYHYKVVHPDYYPLENSFVMEDNFKMEFTHELRPLESELIVTSRPSSSSIWLNNLPQAQKTPAKLVLRPGRYLVSVHSEGYVQTDELVELTANESHAVEMRMSPGKVPQGMTLIPGGEFTMGADDSAPDERPARKVSVKSFYLDRFEVTNQAFQQVFPDHKYLEGQDSLPALGISWTQAVKYCDSVGKRLPTEAEWEKAARGTDARSYPWGEVYVPGYANTTESGIGVATRVGNFFETPSVFGCMDLSGNAYEWVFDWYEAYPGNTDVTKEYGQIYRVLRGGSYRGDKFEARATARHFDRVDSNRRDYGCRCAMNANE